jgi:hypothetical protein
MEAAADTEVVAIVEGGTSAEEGIITAAVDIMAAVFTAVLGWDMG